MAEPAARPVSGPTTQVALTVPSALILGPSGTGKSHLLTSALEHGKKLFVIATEANSLDTIINSARMRKKANPNINLGDLKWAYLPPATLDLDMLRVKSILANTNDMAQLQKLESTSLHRNKFPQYTNFIRFLGNMIDLRSGEVIGNIGKLDDSWVVAVDSFTALTDMCTQSIKGIRPSTNQSEIGLIQEMLKDLINNLCSLRCFFVMTAHIERETDEITGKERIMASTIGKKLAPKVPWYFSEVVRTFSDTTGFWGTTIDPDSTVKARYFPRSDRFPLDLGPLINGYEANKKDVAENPEWAAPTTPQLVSLA